MLSIDNPELPLGRNLPMSHGAFAWWYLDWLGEDGTSVVVIPSFGLPFLPGRASAARQGEATQAAEAPSLHVAVTRGDRPTFSLLQRHAAASATWTDDEMRIGKSVFTSHLDGGLRRFSASLDVEIPGTTDRLRGDISMCAPALTGLPSEPGVHRWTPLAVGQALVDLEVGSEVLAHGTGRAYHDRNGCPQPLGELGIAHWIWGRAPLPDGEIVYYLLWPEGGGDPREIVIRIDSEGRGSYVPVRSVRRGLRVGWYGMPWWRTVDLVSLSGEHLATVTTDCVIDDGPFYLRFHTTVRSSTGVAPGVGEAVRPSRIDGALMRPLVRMAVHDLTSTNSAWLPLFAGPRATRVQRLVGLKPAELESTP